MMKTGIEQKYVDIWPIPFEYDDSINYQIENTRKHFSSLQTISPLHTVVSPMSEATSSTPFNLLVSFNQNM